MYYVYHSMDLALQIIGLIFLQKLLGEETIVYTEGCRAQLL